MALNSPYAVMFRPGIALADLLLVRAGYLQRRSRRRAGSAVSQRPIQAACCSLGRFMAAAVAPIATMPEC